MSKPFNRRSKAELDAAGKVLEAAIHLWNRADGRNKERSNRAFVTVSRQPGAGGVSFSHRLAEQLNRSGAGDWSAWDRELVEKVSAEHGIAKEILEMMPSLRRNWLDELLQGFFKSEVPPDVAEIRAYKQVVMTIRALAAAGHAVIVGRGGRFITHGMPAAIHLRLVAPLEHRLRFTAERDEVSLHEAAAQITASERRRIEFYRRYWPGKAIEPETFTMILNTAELTVDEMVECVLPLIRSRETVGGSGSRFQDQRSPQPPATANN